MASDEKEQVIKLILALILTTAFFFVEIIFGHITNSLSLISDSYNMLSNILSMVFGLVCIRLASKESKKSTFGWARAEIIGALINSVFLVALCFSIFTDSIGRLFKTEEIEHPKTLLIVGSVGLGVNLFGMLLFLKETCGKVKPQKDEGGRKVKKVLENGTKVQSQCQIYQCAITSTQTKSVRVNWFWRDERIDITEEKMIRRRRNLVVTLQNRRHNRVGELTDGEINDKAQDQQHQTATTTSTGQVEVAIEDDDDLDSAWRREKTRKMKTGSQMNIQGVFLHIMGDALGSIVVVVSALVVIYCEGEWRYKVDPALGILMVVIIVATTLPLIKQTSVILLQHLPSHMAVPVMVNEMYKKVQGLEGVHEFHVWQLVGSRMIGSLHVKVKSLQHYKVVSSRLQKFLHSNGIDSITIQPEFPDFECSSDITGGSESSCLQSTCSSTHTSVSHLVSTSCVLPPLNAADHHDYNDAVEIGQTNSEENIHAIKL